MINKWVAALLSVFALFCTAGTAHAARYWVSNQLTDVADADKASVAAPQPVQLIFQFQTNGAANARATNALKNQITQLVRNSGVFSQVTDAPVANGAILSITINDAGDVHAASSQGFLTGLTFGLHGTAVADNYVGTSEFVSGPGAATITKEAHHALVTTIGVTDPPANVTQAANINEAVTTIMRHIVTHLVNDTAKDPGFSGAPAAPVAASAEAPAATAPTAATPPAIAPITPAPAAPAPAPAPAH